MLKQALLAIVTTAALVAADTKPADVTSTSTAVVAPDAPVAKDVVAADTKPADATPAATAPVVPADAAAAKDVAPDAAPADTDKKEKETAKKK